MKFIGAKTQIARCIDRHDQCALTLVEFVILLALVVIAMMLLLPALNKSKGGARIKCPNNLKQIGLSFRVWAGDNNGRYPTQLYTNASGAPLYKDSANMFRYFQVMSNELSNPGLLSCPQDKKRRGPTNFTTDIDSSHVSYFIGLDATKDFPNSFLAGDTHLTNGINSINGMLEVTPNQRVSWTRERHDGSGYILMADGSVQQFSNATLRLALQQSSLATNRLLMPDSPPK